MNLPDQTVIEIAKSVATRNKIDYSDVVLAPAIASTGDPALEIKFVLTPGSSDAIMGERSARTISQVIQYLADKGDDRLPIVRYEEKIAAIPQKST
jgi:hypothetical protein